ncbi:MAG: sulfotransferase [Phycisphaeraceae bacterium]|nr:sulfotransferase [Phycisphaeraceae bacterium]MCB9846969.1 sulfotransferase [Phycisphaeraceae bacterium]
MIRANSARQKAIDTARGLINDGKPLKAAALCKQQLMAPGAGEDPDLLALYATALSAMGHMGEARKILKKGIRLQPRNTELRCRMGITYFHEYRFDEAREHFAKAMEIDPDDGWARRCMADILMAESDYEAAMALLEPKVETVGPGFANAALPLCQVYLKLKKHQEALDLIDKTLSVSVLLPNIHNNFLFFRGDALRGLKRYDESFEAYRLANDSVGAAFDRDRHREEVDRSIAAWSREAVETLPVSRRKSNHLVFIVGMFRSGTSLCEQIIASHPQAYGAGELMHIVDIVQQFKRGVKTSSRALWDLAPLTAQNIDNAAAHYHAQVTPLAPGSSVITDKMPNNLLPLGLIGQMFPDCRVVYCRRDPRDTLLSCYFNRFNADQIAFTYNLDDLGSVFADYWRIMEHWKRVLKVPILEVQYEEMVADPETQNRRLIDFVGLEWNDRCLNFHKTKRTTKTLSADQVNKPIYRSSLARWKPFETHFEPMYKWLPPESFWSPPGGE